MIIHGECLEVMSRMEDNSIDLTVTSPPYDNLRTYKGKLDWSESVWRSIIEELFRVTKDGGVVVWVVGDSVIKGSETGTSFRQALWAMEKGFNLHDTMIYNKGNCAFPESTRYSQIFEYMFVWSKGKPTFNPICDRKNKEGGRKIKGTTERQVDGTLKKTSSERKGLDKTIKEFGARFNVWEVSPGWRKSHTDDYGHKHPATFPEKLVEGHILSWSNEGDTVFDPLMGSGTTGKMAVLNNREFVGIEMEEEYVKIAKARIESVQL